MWGSLRSSSSSTSQGDSKGRGRRATITSSELSSQNSNTTAGVSTTPSTSTYIRPRSSLASLLSSTILSSSHNYNAENLGASGGELLDSETVTHVDSFFDRFWSEISVFAFERAKEIADREKEQALKMSNSTSSSGFTWVILTTAMAQVAVTEKGYMNLAFLAPKGFLRKDSNLKTMLEAIRVDLRKVIDAASVSSSPVRHKNSQIASCLTLFVNLRLEQMEFYDRLSVVGTSKNVEVADLISDIEIIYEKFKDELKGTGPCASILAGILKTIQWENEIVISLLRSMNMMQAWEYLDSTIALQRANTQIQEWTEILQSHSTTLKKSSFYNSPPSYPIIFLWIRKLKGALVSKFSLYFNELLLRNSTVNFDMRTYCSKLPVDYFSRMLSFQKKSDAFCVCIVYDAKDTRYHADGYNCAGKEVGPPQGLDSFPAILSIPTKPVVHWPNLVMIISDRLTELNMDKVVGFFDSSMQATYFVQRIDPKMFLVVIYEAKKSEKDAYTLKFMTELTMELKCGKIFSALKTTK